MPLFEAQLRKGLSEVVICEGIFETLTKMAAYILENCSHWVMCIESILCSLVGSSELDTERYSNFLSLEKLSSLQINLLPTSCLDLFLLFLLLFLSNFLFAEMIIFFHLFVFVVLLPKNFLVWTALRKTDSLGLCLGLVKLVVVLRSHLKLVLSLFLKQSRSINCFLLLDCRSLDALLLLALNSIVLVNQFVKRSLNKTRWYLEIPLMLFQNIGGKGRVL